MTAVLRPVRIARPAGTGQRTLPTTQRATFGTLGLLAMIAFFVGLMVLANFHVVVIGDQFEFDRLERRFEDGLERAQVLRNEVARLENPDRILRVAEGRLGMVPPTQRLHLAVVFPDTLGAGLSAPVGDPFAGGNR
ncbi:MAG: hypothetical protein VYD15_07250 [Actinomycetota bacterium]|nr:hypothetical protein [Actinomycetota bacterium]MED5233395.1 hypothetical protein [Actinomycetota bacterium]MED5393003.1 hypothetical protein [Actinomycetota bacterium]MEE3352875.1 hypothetical protein [Actinomycetota bacterium]